MTTTNTANHMVSLIGSKTMEDPTQPVTTMEASSYLQLIQQLTELQKENIKLWKEVIYKRPSRKAHNST